MNNITYYAYNIKKEVITMVKRDLYLDKIRPFIDKPFIKVITGIRRCGKSTILMMIKEEILDKGIDDSNIVI